MGIALTIKKALLRYGYDVKYYRPFYETILASQGIKSVLDIGANDGHYAKRMLELFPNAKVFSFEPLPDCYERLSALAKEYPAITPIHTALGSEKATLTMERSSFHPSSSMLHMTELHKRIYPKSATRAAEAVPVSVDRLDTIAETLPLAEPFFAKIDVQGYEDKVIEGGKKTLSRAVCIIVETSYLHLYEHQPLFKDVHDLVTSLGFSYCGSLERHYDKDNFPTYEDAIFLRNDLLKR